MVGMLVASNGRTFAGHGTWYTNVSVALLARVTHVTRAHFDGASVATRMPHHGLSDKWMTKNAREPQS